jgi:threonine synthase
VNQPTFVIHLESALDGTRLDANLPHTMHRERPLWVRYDLAAVRSAFRKEMLRHRPHTMWRYAELLPVATAEAVSLAENMTPLVPCPRLATHFGLAADCLWIKDESRLPTGSFKARGLAMAVSMARRFGIRRLAIPTAGNAGGALAAYAARAGIEAFVFMPADTPLVNQLECKLWGARTYLVDGLITDCARIVREGRERLGWFDLSTLKEPYRLEGKKTMGLELAEQCGWRLPELILYPTGGGTGLVGMWKAFEELAELGWLEEARRPRLVAVQSDGCAPLVRAFEAGERFARPWENASTAASGLRVPAAVGDFMILDAIRASGGTAIAVREARLTEWMRLAARLEGISLCPEAAACVGALEILGSRGMTRPNERVVLFNTGAAQKYVEVLAAELPRIADPSRVDWDQLEAAAA